MDTGVVLLGVKRQEHEADHSSPSVTEDKNGGAIFPLPLASLWRGSLIN
jgi:hypothetical protein